MNANWLSFVITIRYRHWEASHRRLDVFFVQLTASMTSLDYVSDPRSSARGDSAEETKRVVYIAGQGDTPWRIY